MKKLPVKLRALITPHRLAIGSVVVVLFALLNVAVYLGHTGTTYANTTVGGKQFGAVSKDDQPQKLQAMTLLPKEITFAYQEDRFTRTPEEIGFSLDLNATQANLQKTKSWLPIINLFVSHEVPAAFHTDPAKLQTFLDAVNKKQQKAPANARIIQKNGAFSIQTEQAGHKVDTNNAKSHVSYELSRGAVTIDLPVISDQAKITQTDLKDRLAQIQKQQNVSVTVRFKDQTKKFTTTEIAEWYEAKGSDQVLTDANISSSVENAGEAWNIRVQNLTQAVAAIKAAVEAGRALDFSIIEAPRLTKSFTYCVAARGVPTRYLTDLSAKLAAVFADKRGWGLGGQVRLTPATTNCSFTVWLSAAGQMPSFGSICDANWSCRVGPNVVINFDRWMGASAAWNKSGGTLENYRVMVINHETGHWFGFGHKHCGGAGQPAPVMQQQSINLQGCKFNPWPLASEQAALKKSLGL